MKTAEEWYNEKEMCGDEDADGNLLPYEFTPDDFRAIQLDAMKEGMRRAAEKLEKIHADIEFEYGQFRTCQCERCVTVARRKQAILSAAEQLTEKDLCPAPHVTNPSRQKE